ncbi:hypothetical protein PIB30_077224 [Stylosanthes scabra]|uniref:Uncharacterized protein n=1 Tax=Stylosanthes scabra TaxID=79078 RepID=A0ABU6VQT7_9FABA|nr:hypothetical protein [Stylosanthes scabra]
MSEIHRRLNQQQEENRKSFEAINTRMDRMDDQLSFLCYSNQMANEQMLFPYRNTTRQFKEMEMQGIPVTMANLAIHRQREEEMNQERMRVCESDHHTCWAHQQANPNLCEIPITQILDLMQTNAEKGRPMFYGCLKSDYGASFSSQAHPQEPVPLRTAPPIPGYQPPHPPPN